MIADTFIVREIQFNPEKKVGRFEAFDYFGDGSYYILNAPGHAIGHICALARVTSNPDSYIFVSSFRIQSYSPRKQTPPSVAFAPQVQKAAGLRQAIAPMWLFLPIVISDYFLRALIADSACCRWAVMHPTKRASFDRQCTCHYRTQLHLTH